jgi:hypothetical protein
MARLTIKDNEGGTGIGQYLLGGPLGFGAAPLGSMFLNNSRCRRATVDAACGAAGR